MGGAFQRVHPIHGLVAGGYGVELPTAISCFCVHGTAYHILHRLVSTDIVSPDAGELTIQPLGIIAHISKLTRKRPFGAPT